MTWQACGIQRNASTLIVMVLQSLGAVRSRDKLNLLYSHLYSRNDSKHGKVVTYNEELQLIKSHTIFPLISVFKYQTF